MPVTAKYSQRGFHQLSRAKALSLAAVGLGAVATAGPAIAESDSAAESNIPAEAETTPAITILPEDVARYAPQVDTVPLGAVAPAVGLQGKALIPPGKPKKSDIKLVVSQFVDVPAAGSADPVARYSGRADAYISLGGSSFGLDDSWQLNIRPEFTWGKTSNGVIGLIPNNTALFRPEGAGDFDVSVNISKTWPGGTNLTVGKINVLDISGALPVVESDGHFGFQNLGLALPPTAVVPNTLVGAQLTVPTEKFIYRFWVFDPDSQYERTGFETGFESGVGFMGAAAYKARIGKMPGIYNFAVVGSTRKTYAVDILPRALTPPPPPIGTFGDESGELAVQLSAYQFIKLYPEAPGKGWGILARFQASTGDPTFLDYSGYLGVSGNPRGRPQDRFGFAWFQYSLTDELVNDIAFRLPLEDEWGIEAFYTVGIGGPRKDKFQFTINAQVIDSAVAFRDTGLLVGGRLTTVF